MSLFKRSRKNSKSVNAVISLRLWNARSSPGDICDLSGIGFEVVPEDVVGTVKGCKKTVLKMNGNNIHAVPTMILSMTFLKVLSLESNRIHVLPDAIGNMVELRILNISSNALKALPDTIGKLVNLQEFFISNNKLQELPGKLLYASNLVTLDLSHNLLSSLPMLGLLENLENLDVSGNSLLPSFIPQEILNMGCTAIKNRLSSPNGKRERSIRSLQSSLPEGTSSAVLKCESDMAALDSIVIEKEKEKERQRQNRIALEMEKESILREQTESQLLAQKKASERMRWQHAAVTGCEGMLIEANLAARQSAQQKLSSTNTISEQIKKVDVEMRLLEVEKQRDTASIIHQLHIESADLERRIKKVTEETERTRLIEQYENLKKVQVNDELLHAERHKYEAKMEYFKEEVLEKQAIYERKVSHLLECKQASQQQIISQLRNDQNALQDFFGTWWLCRDNHYSSLHEKIASCEKELETLTATLNDSTHMRQDIASNTLNVQRTEIESRMQQLLSEKEKQKKIVMLRLDEMEVDDRNRMEIQWLEEYTRLMSRERVVLNVNSMDNNESLPAYTCTDDTTTTEDNKK